jgi:hypothetical protein
MQNNTTALKGPDFEAPNQFAVLPGDTPANRLPRDAEAKWRQIREQREELAAIYRPLSDERQKVAVERSAALARRQRLELDRRVRDDHPEYARIAALIQSLDEKAGRLDERLERVTEARAVVIALDDRVAAYLQKHSQVQLLPFSGNVALGPDDSIENVRQKIVVLKADRRAAAAAPLPSGEAKRLMREMVDEFARRGTPGCHRLFEGVGSITLPRCRADVQVIGDGKSMPPVVFTEVVDLLPVLAWLFPDQLVKRLNMEVDQCADDGRALSEEERATKISEIEKELLGLERQEETLFVRTPGALRRRDVDLRALLHLSDDAPSSGADES